MRYDKDARTAKRNSTFDDSIYSNTIAASNVRRMESYDKISSLFNQGIDEPIISDSDDTFD